MLSVSRNVVVSDGSAGESQDRSSCISWFPVCNVRREPRIMFGSNEHLISSMSLATCRMTNLVSCAATLACSLSESIDVRKS